MSMNRAKMLGTDRRARMMGMDRAAKMMGTDRLARMIEHRRYDSMSLILPIYHDPGTSC